MGLVVLAVALALTPGYHARVQPIPAAMRAQMTGVSWHAGCPVGLSELRLITLTYRGFDGRDHAGRLIANRTAAAALVDVFRRLYAARFPIRRMEPVDRYGGDDYRSIEADNTSSFNCRNADRLEPLVEPRVRPRDRRQPDREPVHLGRAQLAPRPARRTSTVRATGRGWRTPAVCWSRRSAPSGWGWGGSWAGSVQDTQHFSSNGR